MIFGKFPTEHEKEEFMAMRDYNRREKEREKREREKEAKEHLRRFEEKRMAD